MKIEKGTPGYIKRQKTRLLIQTAISFGIVIAILVFGYLQTGTKLNLFTVVAILGCLPASRILVEWIAIAPHSTVDAEKADEISRKAPNLTAAYDLVITSREKIMPVDAVVISGHTVCGYTKAKKADPEKTAAHIRQILAENEITKITVKIFSDYTAFLARAEGMNSIAEVERADSRQKEEKIRRIILNISM